MDKRTYIKSCQEGDRNSFRFLVDEYSGFAFRVAFRIMHEEEEAKDVVQESFISAWKNIKTFNPENKFEGWFYRIIVNKCYDRLRKTRKETYLEISGKMPVLQNLFSYENPESYLNTRELGDILKIISSSLSPSQKIVFSLSVMEGLSHSEISEITGMNKGSVKSNLSHARKNIEELLESYYG